MCEYTILITCTVDMYRYTDTLFTYCILLLIALCPNYINVYGCLFALCLFSHFDLSVNTYIFISVFLYVYHMQYVCITYTPLIHHTNTQMDQILKHYACFIKYKLMLVNHNEVTSRW